MRFTDGKYFAAELIRKLISKPDTATLSKLETEGRHNTEAKVALTESLTEIVVRCLDGLTLVESVSELPNSATGRGNQISLVKCTFSAPTRAEIEERVRATLEERNSAQGAQVYQLVTNALLAATGNSLRISFWRPVGNGHYIDIDEINGLPGYEQEYFDILSYLLLARLQDRHNKKPDRGCVVLLDDTLRFAERLPSLAEIIIAWQLQIIYLSANMETYVGGRIFSLQTLTRPGNDEPLAVIRPAVTLMTLRSGSARDSSDPIAAIGTIPVDQIFDVLPTPTDVKPGDLLVPTIRRVGRSWSVRVVSETRNLWRPNLATTLRPHRPLNMGEDLFYASYLGSDALFGEKAIPGQVVLIPAHELAQIQLPRPDRDALRAINELTAAARVFDSWRRDADDAISSFFQWRDPAVARANIIEAGRQTRQRREAAHMLDDAGPRFRATLPYPIARRWRDVGAAAVDESEYRRILDCAETAIAYCAALGLAFASAHSVAVARIRAIASKLRRPQSRPAFGDWSSVVDNLADIARSDTQPMDSPLRNYRCFVDETKSAIQDLKGLRNDISHGRGPANHEISAHILRAKANLDTLLRAIEWLVDYPFRYVEAEHWDSFANTSTLSYRELMGDHNVVGLDNDQTSGHLESHSTYAVDQFGRHYLLRPFCHTEYCSTCGQLSVFVIDAWDPVEQHATYKSMDHSHVTLLTDASAALRAVGLLPS
jgi:hypothetical protein